MIVVVVVVVVVDSIFFVLMILLLLLLLLLLDVGEDVGQRRMGTSVEVGFVLKGVNDVIVVVVDGDLGVVGFDARRRSVHRLGTVEADKMDGRENEISLFVFFFLVFFLVRHGGEGYRMVGNAKPSDSFCLRS